MQYALIQAADIFGKHTGVEIENACGRLYPFKQKNKVKVGDRAEITVIDLNADKVIDPADFFSKGKATPFEGWKVHAECKLTICGENVAYNNID